MDKIAEESGAVPAGHDDHFFSGGVLEMTRQWSYFLGAVVLAGYVLISHGAPLVAVTAGATGAALLFWRRSRASRSS
jgi:Flp pilus assembly protein TadB